MKTELCGLPNTAVKFYEQYIIIMRNFPKLKISSMAVLMILLLFLSACNGSDPPPPPPPPVQVDTVRTTAHNINEMQDWVSQLPATIPTNFETFHELSIGGNIAIDAAGGRFPPNKLFILRDVNNANGRRDTQVFWNSNHIDATDSVHITPPEWVSAGRPAMGGNNWWTKYADWNQFGDYSRLLRIIDPPFERIPRMTDEQILAGDGTIVPDTIEITRNHQNVNELWAQLPSRPGHYIMITNNWSLGDMTPAQLRRISQPAIRSTDIRFPEADIYATTDIAFRSITTNTMDEHLMHRIAGMRNIVADVSNAPYFISRWGHTPWGTVNTSEQRVPIQFNRTPESTKYFSYLTRNFYNSSPGGHPATWSRVTFVTLRSFQMSFAPIYTGSGEARYIMDLTGSNAVIIVVPDEFTEELGQDMWNARLRQFVINNGRLAITDIARPPLGGPFDIHSISESNAARMGRVPRDVPLYRTGLDPALSMCSLIIP